MYCDKQTGCIERVSLTEAFMERNLYRDEVHNADDPVKIERDLAQYERKASDLIKQFRDKDEVTLTEEDDALLKLFLSIMSFRSDRTREYFESEMKEADKKFYRTFQEDMNFSDFWIRNLGHLVTCRSYEDVHKHPDIDDAVKAWMLKNTTGWFGTYFVLAEKRGHEEFIIGDDYPIDIYGLDENGQKREFYSIFPISPDRALFLVYNGVQWVAPAVRGFDMDFLKSPTVSNNGRSETIKVKKIYENDVRKVNAITYNSVKKYFAFRDCDAVSIDDYKTIHELWMERL